MNFRKVCTGILASSLVVSMMVTSAMAETNEGSDSINHAEHDKNRENGTITKEPTCTETGEIQYTCSEDAEKYTEVLPAKGHDWEYRTDVEATYDTPGVESLYCKICNVKKENSEREIPRLIKYVEQITLNQEELTFSAAGETAIWESSDEKIASVDSNGKVTAHKNGIVIITVKSNDGNAEASCKVTVNGKEGVLQDANGQWYYYQNGVIARGVDTIAENQYGWWKITDGKVDFGYTGIASNQNGTWKIVKGKVDFSCSGIVPIGGDWWKVEAGRINLDYTGIAENQNGWWRIENGRVNFKYTGVAGNEYGWWRVENGRVNFRYNGVAQNEYGWWYIRGGKVNFNYWGIAQNENGWWKIDGGKVNFNYTGVAGNEYGWWRVENGRVNFNYWGIAQNEYGWWKIDGGKVNFGYNGVAKNEYGYWYLRGGKVDFGYTGSCWYGNAVCQVVGGKVQLHAEDVYVSDRNSIMYGKTLRLFYDVNGNVIQDVSGLIGSNHTYEIYVNKTKNMVTVYTTEGSVYIPVKRFICSQGGSNTPEGIFYSPAKYRWQELMGPSWGQWCTRINGGVLFHSVFYNKYQNNQALSVNAYNKLGTTCSHGCVRLTAGDAKWIYDNCPVRTKIVVYSSGGYEPFSKPTAYKLPSWHTWDPTDPTMYWKCQQNHCH